MDEQILFALVLLNIAGGDVDVVEDIEQLERDWGLAALIPWRLDKNRRKVVYRPRSA